jgi:hypothetical protein
MLTGSNFNFFGSPHRKHSHYALEINDVISIIVELLPAADSARDLCPSELF